MRENGNLHSLYQSILGFNDLKKHALSFLRSIKAFPYDSLVQEEVATRKRQIADVMGGTDQQWADWKWQYKNRIKDSAALARILGLSQLEKKRIERVSRVYRWAVSPYYLSLVGPDYMNSPIYRQAVPDTRELIPVSSPAPINEAHDAPTPCLTRKHSGRMTINVTNQCAMYCRHCLRKPTMSQDERHACLEDIESTLDYAAINSEIREVIISGGDPFLLGNSTLDFILLELDKIPHIEKIQIKTRTPATLPQRITPELCGILGKYPSINISTQFNHPLEITPEAQSACARLIEAGIVVGSRSVLLPGINDQPNIMRKLDQELLKIKVHPQHISHTQDVEEIGAVQTDSNDGINKIRSLHGYTSDSAIAPHRGRSKILTPRRLPQSQ
ncbi:MAG TPA: KamA family radical SAM protein [Syntrophomonadaceae bacterium]|nr:KamA family radical SAM protein [Syntrophomonadaceae bacterium]